MDRFSFEVDTLPWQCSDRDRGVGEACQCRDDLSLRSRASQSTGVCSAHETLLPEGQDHSQHPPGASSPLPLLVTPCRWASPAYGELLMSTKECSWAEGWSPNVLYLLEDMQSEARKKIGCPIMRGKDFGENLCPKRELTWSAGDKLHLFETLLWMGTCK